LVEFVLVQQASQLGVMMNTVGALQPIQDLGLVLNQSLPSEIASD